MVLSRSVRIFKRWSLIEDFGLFGNNLEGVVLIRIFNKNRAKRRNI